LVANISIRDNHWCLLLSSNNPKVKREETMSRKCLGHIRHAKDMKLEHYITCP